jgi:uncharacterized protein (TIGR03118 family)
VGGSNPAIWVDVPPPKGGTPPSAPTGIVANSAFAFALKDKSPAIFIFSAEDGTISAWNLGDGLPSNTSPATAELKVDNSAKRCSNGATGAVYKGLAMGVNAAGVFLYATNFRCGTVDVFNSSFIPALPAGYGPFGIATIRGDLVVTYAKQDAKKHDDVKGPGNGFVDIFDTSGNLIERFATRGVLNSPWAVVEAPFKFGSLSNDLLIGNFGDGKINAFKSNRVNAGALMNQLGKPIVIDGLWALTFGGASLSSPDTLYFTAGPNGETNGLVGSLTPQ